MTNKQLECVELLGYTSQGAVRIHGGGNNRLFILKTEPACIAKIYHQDEKNRALHDVKISELFAQNGINNIAKPLDWDLANHVAIFDFLDGEKPDKINKKYIHQIADFIANINSNKIRSYLDKTFHAAEACFSWAEYAQVLQQRLNSLLCIKTESVIDQEAKSFIRHDLAPKLTELLSLLPNESQMIADHLRIVSPSDFGLHNCLDIKQQLFFFDFEYAGWDDPCKMIADFFSHPAFDVPLHYIPEFIELSLKPEQQAYVLSSLANVFKIIRFKWVCIMLNEFRVADSLRRMQALDCDIISRKTDQLAKAKHAFSLMDQDINEYLTL